MSLFQTFDEEGKLQLDCDLFSHFLRHKGIGVSISRRFGNTEPSDVEITVPADCKLPLVGIQCAYGVGMLAYNFDAAGTKLWQGVCAGPVGTPYSYWIFDSSAFIQPNSGLFELYSPDGRVTFSDAAKPMIGLDLISVGSTDGRFLPWVPSSAGSSASYGSRNLCWVQGCSGGHSIAGDLRYYGSNGQEQPDPETNARGIYRYQNNGKVYGARVEGGAIYAGGISYDDVLVTVGTNITRAQALRLMRPNWRLPVVGFAVDVTHL